MDRRFAIAALGLGLGLGLAFALPAFAQRANAPPTCQMENKSYAIGASIVVAAEGETRGGTFAKATCRKCQADGTWGPVQPCE